ncbi:hypothetical protein BON30_17200 [Cystobacter ferrugineus]|uniref:Uncharacterized protein n=1 Tax=Cystobacter ferrugineus TaxID=83449 RepID=A0A1L9BAG2_9BACT|nr:hypothetical protein BON30_17200 [Cystobacter ferrugineus]
MAQKFLCFTVTALASDYHGHLAERSGIVRMFDAESLLLDFKRLFQQFFRFGIETLFYKERG